MTLFWATPDPAENVVAAPAPTEKPLGCDPMLLDAGEEKLNPLFVPINTYNMYNWIDYY